MQSLYTRSYTLRPRLRAALASALALIVLFPGAALAADIIGSGLINGTGSADRIVGSSGIDTINGNGGNDQIYGGAGDDKIDCGGGSDDKAIGGPGNDTFSNCESVVQ